VPTAQRYGQLLARAGEAGEPGGAADTGQPYPFFLAQALDLAPAGVPSRLGPVTDWQVEWKFSGLRVQVVKRAGQVWIWSRGDELLTGRFPEVVAQALAWPDGVVLDGELRVGQGPRPGPLALLQQRVGRKTVTKKLLAEAPVAFMACDLLEHAGQDQRARPQHERRAALLGLAATTGLRVSPELEAADWPAVAALRAQAREHGAGGLMLKHREATYGSGRTHAAGPWWKWKIDPMSVDCVLIYAQAGPGPSRRAGDHADCTFAVWSRPPAGAAEAQAVVEALERREPARPGALQLVPVAKARLDAALSEAEMGHVDSVIRATTLERFGPVRSVKPTLLFELGFEGIHRSARHKCGLALRLPRLLRLYPDKPLHEAGTLVHLQGLPGLEADEPSPPPEKAG
jgi:DNA ligase-1